ncbi:MAG: iron-sulfur cluster assembly scaffold protein [Caulobacterales bacterium]|uniref:iron-sulfur cluster assembly scaffold protein n=1 Tax=Glycocaulis sp. TaxID=1969725 RepID=UPI003F9ED307
MNADPYSRDVIALAASIPHLKRLEAPQASVRKVSRLCGSEVTLDLNLKDGRVAEAGWDVSACALGQASASILGERLIGADRDMLAQGLETLNAMLKGTRVPQEGPFARLAVLEPASAYPARHGSIRLAFEAALEAFDRASGPRD